jgi:hypothetical protein
MPVSVVSPAIRWQVLRDLGVDPADPAVRTAVHGVKANCRWEYAGEPFFDGEVEPCINGGTVAVGAYFGEDVGIVGRLVAEQLEDGGWNCAAESGSTRSSFHSTICVLDGLLEYEHAGGGTQPVAQARRRGEDYLLSRRLFRRASTGEVVDLDWLQFSFPPQWHYDVLRGLDYFRSVGGEPDSRLSGAIGHVRDKQQSNGTWLLENTHPGLAHFELEDGDGEPSRWNTLRALRVLRWYDAAAS